MEPKLSIDELAEMARKLDLGEQEVDPPPPAPGDHPDEESHSPEPEGIQPTAWWPGVLFLAVAISVSFLAGFFLGVAAPNEPLVLEHEPGDLKTEIERVAYLFPDCPYTAAWAGSICFKEEDYERCIIWLDRAVSLGIEDGSTLAIRAHAHRLLGNTDAANRDMAEAERLTFAAYPGAPSDSGAR